MNEFWKRVISALFFVIIMLFLVIFSHWTLLLFAVITSSFCIYEFLKMHANNSIPDILFSLVSNLLILSFAANDRILATPIALAVLAVVSLLYIAFHLRKNGTSILDKISNPYFSILYIGLPFYAFLSYSLQNTSAYDWHRPLLIFFLVWASDTFAYLSGRLFGKHLLYPEISPKKTTEGLIGGTIFAAVTGAIISYFWDIISPADGIALGILVSLFGTMGDFFESALKRRAGIKDSGKMMPGHGGFLDRFDAFLFASVVVYIYFLWK